MIIQCPECGKDVSDTIDACIHCGYRLKPSKRIDITYADMQKGAIAKRGRAGGGTKFICAMGFVLTILASLIMMPSFLSQIERLVRSTPDFYDYLCFFLFIAGYGFLAFLMTQVAIFWHRARLNGDNPKPLAYVTENDECVHLIGLDGRDIAVEPKNIISVVRGITTDFLLVANYINENGSMTRLILGWTPNYREAVENFSKITSIR